MKAGSVMEKLSYTYIMTSKMNGTPYIGVTADLITRVYQHRNKLMPGSTAKYNVTLLVYYEQLENIYDAISREKQLKSWPRQWKLNLINSRFNPSWNDLYDDICC
jgi:putative endonuclease